MMKYSVFLALTGLLLLAGSGCHHVTGVSSNECALHRQRYTEGLDDLIKALPDVIVKHNDLRPHLPEKNWRETLKLAGCGEWLKDFTCCFVTLKQDRYLGDSITYHCHLKKLNDFKAITPGDSAYRDIEIVGGKTFVNGYLLTTRERDH